MKSITIDEPTLPYPIAAFNRDGSVSVSGVMVCRTADFDVWRFVCPICSIEPFHEVRADWSGQVLTDDIPKCSSLMSLKVFTEAQFDEAGRDITDWPNRFLSYGDGVLWPAAIAGDLLGIAKSRLSQRAFDFKGPYA